MADTKPFFDSRISEEQHDLLPRQRSTDEQFYRFEGPAMQPLSRPTFRSRLQSHLSLILAMTFGAYIIFSLSWMRSTPSLIGGSSSSLSQPHCGNTTDSARQRGCVFDIMSFSWLPPVCFDGELHDQFLAEEPWHWYRTDSLLEEVPIEVVRQREADHLYVDWHYHQLHCTYMWKKLHRAILNKRPWDEYIGSYVHTEHCEWVLATDCRYQNDSVKIQRKFVACAE